MQQPGETWSVVCLCAEWCGVCRDWRAAFAQQAREHPALRFAWVDVEDEAEAMGDFDVETFPTVLVARAQEVLFLGPVTPSSVQLSRLLQTLQANPRRAPGVPADADDLLRRLAASVLPRTSV